MTGDGGPRRAGGSRSTAGARQLLGELARPDTLRRLMEVGVLHPRFLAASAAALPWAVGRGPSLGLLSQIHALARARKTAVVDRDGELSWLELDQRVNQLARGLGTLTEPDDEVALLLRNGRQFVETVLASQKTGRIAAPLNTWARTRELAGVLDRERPRVLVYDTRHAGQLRGAVRDRTALVHVGPDDDALPGSRPYPALRETGSRLPPAPVTARRGSAKVLIHTSGTTGTPKAAARGTGTESGAAALGVLDAVPFRHDDVMYMPNPLFHAFGLFTFAVGMFTGATMVLPDSFDPARAWRDLVDHGITAASLVPVMLRRMLDVDDPPDVRPDRLRILLASGAAMPPGLRRRVRERFGEVLYDLYGSTEAGWIAIATPASLQEAPAAVGRPVAGVEVAILDDAGRPASDGEGEIHVRSMATFDGYASGERSDHRAGYLATGDLGYLDDAGYLHVVGRADDMAVVGGENVYPDEVEAVIEELSGVTEVAVIGVDDDEMGQVLAAFVVGDADRDRIVTACREQLPSYKVPRRVHTVEELPRTSTGKVLRTALAEPDRD